MTVFAFRQLQALWISQGGPPGWSALMAGIAFAESSGTATEVQPTQPPATTGWGLWQITPGTRAMLTPAVNARLAVGKFAAAPTPLDPWYLDRTWKAWDRAGRPRQPSVTEVKVYLASWGWITVTPGFVEGSDMAVTIGTTLVAVDGVTTTGHKVVMTAKIATRADAKAWSVMDLTDAAKLQGVATTTFVS